MKIALALIVAAIATAAGAVEGTTWRWQDAGGVVHYSDKPPPADARNVQELRGGQGNFIDSDALPYATRKAAADHPVTLYTAASCIDECKSAREFLTRRGVPFSELMLAGEQDIAGYRKIFGDVEAMVPSITVGNAQKMRGFEATGWTRMLDDAGYAKAPLRSAPAH